MGKLRDWWPSDEMLQQSRASSSPNLAAAGGTGAAPAVAVETNGAGSALRTAAAATSTTPSAVTLRLSEVAAALNAMPNHPRLNSTASSDTPTSMSEVAVSNSPSTSKPAIKLTNSQVHKEELLKKLLSRSESCNDLQIGLSQKAGITTSTRPASLPSSPVRGGNTHQTNGRKCFSAILEKGLQGKAVKASNSPTTALTSEMNSTELRKRKRVDSASPSLRSNTNTSSQETQENVKTPMTPVATSPEVSGISKGTMSRREIHIFSERQRRKGMTHLYTILHSLLPDAKPKTDRCTVLTEAMEYIHELQSRLNELVTQKNDILASIGEQLNTSSLDTSGVVSAQGGADDAKSGRQVGNVDDLISEEMREEILAAADVVVRFCGRDAFVTLNSPKRNGVWSAILHVFYEQDMELLNVTLSSSNDMDYHCIHAKVSNSELHSSELQQMLQDVVLNHAILD